MGKWSGGKQRKKEKEPHLSFLLLIPLTLPPPLPVLCRLDCHCSRSLIFRIRGNRFTFHISLPAGSRDPERSLDAKPKPRRAQIVSRCPISSVSRHLPRFARGIFLSSPGACFQVNGAFTNVVCNM